jgi:F0F1-type ATP synthase assembly protein I
MPEVPKPPDRRGDAGVGWAVLSTLLAGILVWGGIGWLIDRWLHTWVGIVVGMLVGFAGAIYLIIRKYGN